MKSLMPAVFVGFLVLITLSHCARKNAAVMQSSMALTAALDAQNKALQVLEDMSDQANRADSARKINHATNQNIQHYVVTGQKNVAEITQKMRAAQADIQALKNKTTDKKEAEILANANRLVFESSEMIGKLEKDARVINGFLNSETFSKSEIGALFKPGEYRLIREQVRESQRLFSPVVEKLYGFASQYEGVLNLEGSIYITGYSDATAVEPGSALYRDLAGKLGADGIVSSQQLNRKLSELRAKAVQGLLEEMIADRKKKNQSLMKISLHTLGVGEEVPPGLPLEIPKNDRRRRAVTFYWVVLPESSASVVRN